MVSINLCNQFAQGNRGGVIYNFTYRKVAKKKQGTNKDINENIFEKILYDC